MMTSFSLGAIGITGADRVERGKPAMVIRLWLITFKYEIIYDIWDIQMLEMDDLQL